jgi:nucleotide-binding universal stress UspA family protein
MSAAATDRPYTVVVGVSATSKSPAALVWAAAQARANHGRLVAVRVLKRPAAGDLSDPSDESPQGPGTPGHEAALAADVAEALGPDHEAECRVLYGGKRSSMLAVAAGADLLVIDGAQRPSSSSLLAQRIIAAAQCPVVVMPPALTDEPPSGLSKAGHAMGQAALRAMGTSGRPGYRPPERV